MQPNPFYVKNLCITLIVAQSSQKCGICISDILSIIATKQTLTQWAKILVTLDRIKTALLALLQVRVTR
jgi:hypothetical protein